jgi:hypothetical protein
MLKKFFLLCSGATLDILDQPECKTELSRYRMMGAFVFLTAVFASLSGGFALYAGFKKLGLAIPIGLLWGTFIFTLDRFIVSSIRKSAVDSNTTAGDKIVSKLMEILTALPRLIMAVFIAVTVAVPLELKYFEPEINAQLSKNYIESAKGVATDVREGMPEINDLEAELKRMDDNEKGLRDRRDLLRDQRFKEVKGESGDGFTGKPGIGPEARKREAEYLKVESDYEKVTQQNQTRSEKVRERLDQLRLQLAGKIDDSNQVQAQRGGFLEQFKALNQLEDQDDSVNNATRFLVILLTLIETAPVLIKLFARRGPYDDLLEAVEHKAHIAKKKEISDFNSEINKELEHYEANSEDRWLLQEQLRRSALSLDQIHDRASDELKEAQSEIAKATVSAWKRKELQEIKGALKDGSLLRSPMA